MKRRTSPLGVGLAVLFLAGAAYATVPHEWMPGSMLTAKELNENFEHVSVLTGPGGKKVSMRIGGYCGATAAPHDDGNAGGYAGVKLRCESACSSETARICTGSDLVVAQSVGLAIPEGRYSVPIDVTVNDPSATYSDCTGFTESVASHRVAFWFNGRPGWQTCDDTQLPFLCCD